MSGDSTNRDEAIEITKKFAEEDERCAGEFGDIIDIRRDDNVWIVEFRTHTFSDTYTHQIRITRSVGNVISYERESKFE